MADPKPHMYTCPGCGLYGPAESFTGEDDNKGFAALLGEIGHRELANVTARYLGLFRPAKRRITALRARRLLEELLPMIKAERISRDGTEWAAPPAVWISAMLEMLELRDARKLNLPMESHGYLLDVMVTHAGKAERKAAEERDAGTHVASMVSQAVSRPVESQAERMARLKREAEEKEREIETRREFLRRQVDRALGKP